jgi:hypothetical protein
MALLSVRPKPPQPRASKPPTGHPGLSTEPIRGPLITGRSSAVIWLTAPPAGTRAGGRHGVRGAKIMLRRFCRMCARPAQITDVVARQAPLGFPMVGEARMIHVTDSDDLLGRAARDLPICSDFAVSRRVSKERADLIVLVWSFPQTTGRETRWALSNWCGTPPDRGRPRGTSRILSLPPCPAAGGAAACGGPHQASSEARAPGR